MTKSSTIGLGVNGDISSPSHPALKNMFPSPPHPRISELSPNGPRRPQYSYRAAQIDDNSLLVAKSLLVDSDSLGATRHW